MALPAVLQKVLDWLHAGYPTGIPQTDYYPCSPSWLAASSPMR